MIHQALKKLARFGRPQKISQTRNEKPASVQDWLHLIQDAKAAGTLTAETTALVDNHDLKPGAHAVTHFSKEIESKGLDAFRLYAQDPRAHLEDAVHEIVKWKTVAQCGHSHDVSKGYFIDAEPYMAVQWNQIIYPLIKDINMDVTLDLACGHGRNTEYLRQHAKVLHLVDVNASCIDACRERFGDNKNGTTFFYHVTDGNSLRMIADETIGFVYSWDSMVHFDKLVVRDYVKEIARVLKSGGTAFLHHSNYGETAPDSDWAHNVGTRSDMSGALMRDYAAENNLKIVKQAIQGRKEGWGQDGLDCVSLLQKS